MTETATHTQRTHLVGRTTTLVTVNAPTAGFASGVRLTVMLHPVAWEQIDVPSYGPFKDVCENGVMVTFKRDPTADLYISEG